MRKTKEVLAKKNLTQQRFETHPYYYIRPAFPQKNLIQKGKKKNPQRNVCWMPERGMFLGQYSVKALHSLPPFVRGHLTPKF